MGDKFMNGLPPAPSPVMVHATERGDDLEPLPSDWRQWDSEQIFTFIMSTVPDGGLEVYTDSIREEIFEGEYDGAALELVTLEHIKVMGIRNIAVANAVYAAVMELREGPQNEGVEQEEGGTAVVAEGVDM